jgi:PAS domain S-box-containing protein
MQAQDPEVLRSLYELGSELNSHPQTQILKVLEFCCETFAFDGFATLEVSSLQVSITHCSLPQRLLDPSNRVFNLPNLNIPGRGETEFSLEGAFKVGLETALDTKIEKGLCASLQNSFQIERILVFFRSQKKNHINADCGKQLKLTLPYISYLLDRDHFQNLAQLNTLRLQNIIQGAPMPMAMLDKRLRFLCYNKEWLLQNDIESNSITGQSIFDVMPHHPEGWNSTLSSCLQGKFEINRDDMYLREDGRKRYLRWSASPWYDLSGQIKGVILTTDSNEELAEKRDLAIQSSKMKTDFLAQMSHEIRNPLNGIIGITDLFLETELNEKQAELAGMIKCCSDSLFAIVNDILDITKIESGAMDLEETQFDMKSLLEEAKSIYLPSALRKRLSLAFQIDLLSDNKFFGDPTKIRQVLCNILANAVKFTDKGSVLLTCNEQLITASESKITFNIIDSGIGIEASKLQDLFKPFTQANSTITRKFGGSGLGLYISKGLAELMGGTIEIKSQPNKGSTFTFFLNLKRAELNDYKPLTAPALSKDQKVYSQKSILIVDDNHINRKLELIFLQRLGLTADLAADGFEAIDYCSRTQYDLILMDCLMEGMDGYTATHKILELPNYQNEPKPKIIAITANASTDDMKKCLSSGMTDYLPKPINFCKFREIIEKNLG